MKSIFDRSTNIFNRVKNAFKEIKEESTFYNVRKILIDYIGKKEDIDTCTLTLHLEKEEFEVKVSFDIYYTSKGKVYRQNNNKLSYNLFEDCGMPKYIVDELDKTNHCDIGFTFDDLKQMYDEMSIEIVSKLSYKDIFTNCETDFDSVKIIDRVFYTRLEYYSKEKLVEQIHVGLISDIPSVEYADIYPYKLKIIKKK